MFQQVSKQAPIRSVCSCRSPTKIKRHEYFTYTHCINSKSNSSFIIKNTQYDYKALNELIILANLLSFMM